MIVAMVIGSILCVLIGIFPSIFYQILPYSVNYQPYDFSHVLSQLQLLTFAAFAFICLWHFKIYPPELNSTVLNSDWFYRRMLPAVISNVVNGLKIFNKKLSLNCFKSFNTIKNFFHDIMFENKEVDREVGFDAQIVLQIFGIIVFILIFINIK